MAEEESRMHCMSIHTCYVDEMRSGVKQIELRKYDPGIEPGEWVAIYETLPTGSIRAAFEAGDTLVSDPDRFWFDYEKVLGIEKEPYFEYFRGRPLTYGILIREFVEFEPLTLGELREGYSFTAPQGIVRVKPKLREILEDEIFI